MSEVNERIMRITLQIDDKLLAEAERLTGIKERSALVHEGLKALVSRESAIRLARLGGSEPNIEAESRRQTYGIGPHGSARGDIP